MVPSRRSRHESTTGYRLALWASVAIVGLLAWLDNSPCHLAAPSDHEGGAPTLRKTSSDVLLVVDWEAVRSSPETFGDQDWSGAWLNLLEQEIGPISVVGPSALSQKRLDTARVVVLTASVTDDAPESLRKELRRQALDGKLIVLERPKGELRSAFSANGDAGLQKGREFTYAGGMADPFGRQLLEMPVETEYIGSTSPRDGADTLLSMDGAPVVYATPIGDGTVVTVDFDLGEQLVALQQGRPGDDFRVSPESADQVPVPSVGELTMSPKMSGAEVPWADLLERFLVHGVIARYAAIPTLWPFPNGALGAVVPLHCDDRLGDGGGWMLEYEADQNATSTILTSFDSGLTPAGAAVMERQGGDVGLLWKRAGTPDAIDERIGVWGLEPLARPVSLGAQMDRLRDILPNSSIFTTKIAGGWWARDWTAPLRQLAAADIAVDTTYETSKSGFGFGTGLPFRTFDTDGLPLGVRELPVVVPSGDTEGPSLETLLGTSRNGHLQVLTWSLPPASFADYPEMEQFDRWISSFEKIERADHVMTDIRRLMEFRRSRRHSKLSSRLIRDVSPPENADDEPEDGPGDGNGVLLRVSVEDSEARNSVTVPASIGEHSFDQARRRASRVQGELVAREMQTERANIVGFPVRRIPLEAGSSRIDVYYGTDDSETDE